MAEIKQIKTPDNNVYDIKDAKAYRIDDTVENDLQDGDYVPFYDSSASGDPKQRKTLWSNIKSKLSTSTAVSQNENVLATDKVPYVMRKAKNIANATPYIRETLVGGTIGWNQILQNGNFSDTSGWTSYAGSLSASGNVLTQTKASGSASNTIGIYRSDVTAYVAGHKYFVLCDMKSSAALSNTIYLAVSNQSVSVKGGTLTTSFKTFYNIFNLANVANNYINLYITGMTSYTSQLVLSYKNFMLVDLTLMLGAAIADYVYNMETATSGAGITKLREWGFFTKAYYPYNTGTLLSVQTTGHKVVGFNQWDEQWELGALYYATGLPYDSTTRIRSKYFRCIPNTTYYAKNAANSIIVVFEYDENYNMISRKNEGSNEDFSFTTSSNAVWLRFYFSDNYGTTYKNDICINISYSSANQWDEQWEVGGLYWSNGQPDNSTTTRFRSKNYCDIVGGANYYKQNGAEVYVFLYDENKVLINYVYEHSFTAPMNARYFKILNVTSGTYSDTIYIKLISDSPENGTYEPYRTNTYNVDDVVLRGIPKLDANNLLYYDGDTYSSDGHVIVKYSYVDLGSLDWYAGTAGGFQANISGLKEGLCGLRTAKYRYDETTSFSWANFSTLADKTIYRNSGSGNYTIYVKDTAYSDAASFTTAMNGVLLVYEKSTQSDTTWHPFVNPQYVYQGGTEEYIDTREIPVPVGHITEYMGASDGKFYMPSSPLDDEKYMMTYHNGSILWTRGNAWISLLDGYYDAYAQGQNIALPPNWTRLKISLECHSLDLGDSSKMIENEISRPTYEDGHYMSGGSCYMTFGMYNDLTCSISLSESTLNNETTYYIQVNSVLLGQTATTDYHFWIYYQT